MEGDNNKEDQLPKKEGEELEIPKPPDPLIDLSDRDLGGQKIKNEKKKQHPGPRSKQGARVSPYNEPPGSNIDIRGRKVYNEKNAIPFCPRNNYIKFIMQLDHLIRLGQKMDLIKNEIDESTDHVFRSNGFEPPVVDYSYAIRSRFYTQVLHAYNEISRLLKEPGVRQSPDFDNLRASLEAIGLIILNPPILRWVSFEHSEDEHQSPYLTTAPYTSKWTYDRVEKISWPSDGNGVIIHKIKRDTVKYGHGEY